MDLGGDSVGVRVAYRMGGESRVRLGVYWGKRVS